MVRSAWIRRTGPGIVALLAVGMLTSTTFGARDHPWAPGACAGPAGPAAADDPWFRIDPILGATGGLAGQRLVVGRTSGTGRRALELAPESFAAGPFGSVVLAGTDDGTGSQLLALDVVAGCATTVDTSTDIIRRATLTPDRRGVVEFRLDRRTRADLGIWVKPLGPDGAATRAVAPIELDERFGRTWSTELVWSQDGADLAIQSCGESACRTRVFTPGTGRLRLVDGLDIGPAIGLADGRLVAYLACRGLPCPVVAVTIEDGTRCILAAEAGPAVVVATEHGPRLIHERVGSPGRRLGSVALDGGADQDLGPMPTGLGLAVDGVRSGSAATTPPGWVLLAPDGRLPLETDGVAPVLRHVLDGRVSTLDPALAIEEVTR